jgi:hypothetical protein
MADTKTPKLDDFAKVEVIDSAAKLFAVLSSQKFHSGRWIFRGQAKAAWPLEPSLERFAESICELPGVIEQHAIREFQRRAHQYADELPEWDDILEWLALMRHHGSPTRLLDFTKSPYVAAFFATVDAEKDGAAAIWAIDAGALMKHAAALLEADSYTRMWFTGTWKQREREGHSVTFSDPDIFKALFRGMSAMPYLAAPVEPFQFNKRMVLQQGLFVCSFGNAHDSNFQGGLTKVLEQARSSVPDQDLIFKLVVEPSAHPQVTRELHRMNVTYASLFPDLDGLARSLASVSRVRATTVLPPLRPDWDFDMTF